MNISYCSSTLTEHLVVVIAEVDVQKQEKITHAALYFSSATQGSLFSREAKKLLGHLPGSSSTQAVFEIRPLPWIL